MDDFFGVKPPILGNILVDFFKKIIKLSDGHYILNNETTLFAFHPNNIWNTSMMFQDVLIFHIFRLPDVWTV